LAPNVADLTIRKQVYELLPADFAIASIWEFALDEEDVPGQDEATVRPRPDLERADPSEGLLVAEAEFVSADGTRFSGYVTPQHEPDISLIQPTIITAKSQVVFWLGAFPPESLEDSYAALGKTASELFPTRYRCTVQTVGAPLQGELHGFMHLESLDSENIVTLT
jgi:hypothetical protein